MGAVPGPFSCYLALRGVKTLHLRMREHEKNALEVAKFLSSSQYVEKVIYPGIHFNFRKIQKIEHKSDCKAGFRELSYFPPLLLSFQLQPVATN